MRRCYGAGLWFTFSEAAVSLGRVNTPTSGGITPAVFFVFCVSTARWRGMTPPLLLAVPDHVRPR